MPDILLIEIITLLIGVVSIAAADFAYHDGGISHRFHSLWVSVSITVICLPMLEWTAIVFVGTGMLGDTLVGIVEAMLFLWLYRCLRQLPAVRKLGHGLPPFPPAEQPSAPSCRDG